MFLEETSTGLNRPRKEYTLCRGSARAPRVGLEHTGGWRANAPLSSELGYQSSLHSGISAPDPPALGLGLEAAALACLALGLRTGTEPHHQLCWASSRQTAGGGLLGLRYRDDASLSSQAHQQAGSLKEAAASTFPCLVSPGTRLPSSREGGLPATISLALANLSQCLLKKTLGKLSCASVYLPTARCWW